MQTNEPVSTPEKNNVSTATETSVSPEVTSGRKITNWLLIVLVALLLGSTGFFAYKYYELKQQVDRQLTSSVTSSKVTTPSLSPVLSPSPEIDPTSNWKKVQIKDLNVDPETKIGTSTKGLEIKYPQDWFYLSGESLGGTGAGDFIMSFKSNKIMEDVPKEEIQIQIFLLLPPQEGLYEFVNNYQKTGLRMPVEVKVNNFDGYKGETDKEIKYFLKIDENNIAHIYIAPKDSNLIEISEQILSTFKFVN
jgi:hypothetical protein